MIRLAALIYCLAGPTTAGILIVVMLASGLDTMRPVVLAGLAGFAAAVPISYLIARKLREPRT